MIAAGWRICPGCDPDDNEWPEVEFVKGSRLCKACFASRYKSKDRRAKGLCLDCPSPVEGTVGKALRCARCKRRARNRQHAVYAAKNQETRTEAEAQRRQREDVRARRNARRRELHQERMQTDPAYAAAYRLRRQKESLLSCPYYAKSMETQRRHNADPERQERKRRQALEAYYRNRPERPRPVCATCSTPIAYDGRGAPPKYHQTPECNPHFRRMDTEIVVTDLDEWFASESEAS